MPNQPTILVKKSDGTSVRLTMEEFREYQETKKLRNSETKEIKKLPPEIKTEALATSAPVTEIFVDEAKANLLSRQSQPVVIPAKAGIQKNKTMDPRLRGDDKLKEGLKKQTIVENKKWTKEDHQSLLEEKDEEVKQKPAAASLPSTRDDVYARVVKELKFSISDELRPRLLSLIVSRIKDIRSDEQAEAYALREVKNGGLGLNAVQTNELMKAIGAQLGVKRVTGERVKSERIEKLPARNTITNIAGGKNLETNPLLTSPYKGEEHAGKPIIQDVTAPLPQGKKTIGPVEELGAMTLLNFRRLSADPFVAGKIAREKFKELETESYLLYLDAVKAWRQSPLYKQYLAAMTEAINRRQRINVLLASNNKEQLKENEFMALVGVNEHL